MECFIKLGSVQLCKVVVLLCLRGYLMGVRHLEWKCIVAKSRESVFLRGNVIFFFNVLRNSFVDCNFCQLMMLLYFHDTCINLPTMISSILYSAFFL